MKAGKIPLAVLAAALSLAPGCIDTGGGDQWMAVSPTAAQGDVSLYRDIQFEDIPVPEGYKINTATSYSFQGSMSRSGIINYYGPVDWAAALDFYRAYLPQTGWSLEKTDRGTTVRVLHFVKGREKLIVTVRPERNGSHTEIQLDDIAKNDLLLKGKLPANR